MGRVVEAKKDTDATILISSGLDGTDLMLGQFCQLCGEKHHVIVGALYDDTVDVLQKGLLIVQPLTRLIVDPYFWHVELADGAVYTAIGSFKSIVRVASEFELTTSRS